MKPREVFWLKLVVHTAALLPLAALIWGFWRRQLGPDLIGEVTRRTGRYALLFLILSLVPTVIARVSGYGRVLRVRRELGLYGFMYASLHFLIFVWLDYGFRFGLIWRAIWEGRFLRVGFAALILLLPLALTSTRGWVRRLGRNWRRLHRLTYATAVLAVLHYAWRFKELRTAPLLAGGTLLLLLIARVPPVARALRGGRHAVRSWRRR